jgi:DNA processing protein
MLSGDLPFLISLNRVPGIGAVHARILLNHFGQAEKIFHAPLHSLELIEGIGKIRARSIKSFHSFSESDKEISFIQRYGIRALSIQDPDYPQRLASLYDAPALLFYKGNTPLNTKNILSIVGTRRHTDYGKNITEKLIRGLAVYEVTIVSGLAFGIDAIAHKAALKEGIPTLAVLAHGLASMYPPEHKQLSREILNQGGLLTEYISNTRADKHHFPVRNRIVAGISDCTLVMETAVKGGSMITADLANGYHKDVFAIPGRTTDFKSAGCNWLIRNNQATLLESAADLARMMGWEEKKSIVKTPQGELFSKLNEAERRILELLKEREQVHIDVIHSTSGFPGSRIASALLELEIKDMISSLPGKIYRLK